MRYVGVYFFGAKIRQHSERGSREDYVRRRDEGSVTEKGEAGRGKEKAKGLCKKDQAGLAGEESGEAGGGQKEYEKWLRSPA